MNKENKFPTPRKLRNTAKQSIFVPGQPDFLYRYKEVKETFIEFDGKRKSLGNISDDIHLALLDLAKGSKIKILRITKTSRSPVSSIEGFPSLSIQKHKKDTMIVVPAADQSALVEKVNKLEELLISKGSILQERCNWVCVVDKGKVKVSDEELINFDYITRESIAKKQVPEPVKETQPIATPIMKSMSEKTKSLRDIALKAIKESEVNP